MITRCWLFYRHNRVIIMVSPRGPAARADYGRAVTTIFTWRGGFTNAERNALHAEAFQTKVFDESEWNWGWPGARMAPGHDGCQASARRRHRYRAGRARQRRREGRGM